MVLSIQKEEQKTEWLNSLVIQYEKSLIRLCCAYLRDSAMAEDAVQESFIRAYKAADRFRGESSEKTWLFSIAMNVCRSMRRMAWFRYVDKRVDFDKLPIPVEAPSDTSIALMTEIMRLPPPCMEAVLLYYYEDLTLEEIAQALGLSSSAVSHRLSKARKLLRHALEGGIVNE